ncbi:MAG: hypothetical protein CM15mP117_00030 [Alphaproteobacteria bacterium]|nr:MAG: hypothetical protein CM15mP117_00030 [Alphaproteobacteria bacterium]
MSGKLGKKVSGGKNSLKPEMGPGAAKLGEKGGEI